MSGRMHGDVGRELLVPCLHPSLHLFPFSPLFSLSNLSSRVPLSSTLKKKKKKKKKKILPIFHFTFPERSPILCFPSYQTPFIIFSFAPKLFFFVIPPVFLYPQLLSPPFFFPLSPGSSVFAYHSSVLAVQAANRWQWVVFAGQYLLAHKRLITSRQSQVCICVSGSETHEEGYTLLIRSNSSHLLLELTQHIHTAMFLSPPSLAIYTACRCCQSQL